MKKTGLLNQPISTVIAGLGHRDSICIADAGLPIPDGTSRIDLAVSKGIPAFLDVLDATLGEMQIEGAIIAEELQTVSPEMYNELMKRLSDVEVELVTHTEFKNQTANCKAVVRSGEFTPYANVILIAGVVF